MLSNPNGMSFPHSMNVGVCPSSQTLNLSYYLTGICDLLCDVLSPIGTDLLSGFLLSMKGSSVTSIGGVVCDDFQALKGGSLLTDGHLLQQFFIDDGVTGNAFKSAGFLATGNDGTSGVFLGSDELMVVKVVL